MHFWHTWHNASKAALEKLVVEFNGSNPYGLWVDLRAVGNLDDLNAALVNPDNRTDLPDLVLAQPEQAQTWLDQKQVIDLTPYVQDAQWGFSAEQMTDFFAFVGANATSWTDFPAERDAMVLYYNQTWAKELGFTEPPATVEEFNQQACAASLANRMDNSYENNGTGGWLVNTSNASLVGWNLAFGGSLVDAKGEVVFNTSEMGSAFEMLRKAYDQNCAWSARLNIPYSYFSSRKALFYTGALSDLSVQAHYNLDVQNNDVWIVLPIPGVDGKPVILVSGPSYTILKSDAKRQLAAWVFIRWMSEPAQQARMAQAAGTLPLSKGALKEMQAFFSQNARWASIVRLADQAQSEPQTKDWYQMRPILQDAGRQVFATQTKLTDIPTILEQMDAMAKELRSQGSSKP